MEFGIVVAREEVRIAFKDCRNLADQIAKIDRFFADSWGSQLASIYGLCTEDFAYMCDQFGKPFVDHFLKERAKHFA